MKSGQKADVWKLEKNDADRTIVNSSRTQKHHVGLKSMKAVFQWIKKFNEGHSFLASFVCYRSNPPCYHPKNGGKGIATSTDPSIQRLLLLIDIVSTSPLAASAPKKESNKK